MPFIQKCEGGNQGATILGAHVEGPFINPQKKGAHPPQCMKTFAKVSILICLFKYDKIMPLDLVMNKIICVHRNFDMITFKLLFKWITSFFFFWKKINHSY